MLQQNITNRAEFKFQNFKRKKLLSNKNNYSYFIKDLIKHLIEHLIKHHKLDLQVILQTWIIL